MFIFIWITFAIEINWHGFSEKFALSKQTSFVNSVLITDNYLSNQTLEHKEGYLHIYNPTRNVMEMMAKF